MLRGVKARLFGKAGGSRVDREAEPNFLSGGRIGMELCLRGLAKRGFQPLSVLDIGAAVGSWTKLALYYWPEARYFMLEPLEEHRASLQSMKELHPNVDYILAGAADQPGKRTLGVTQSLLDSSFAYGGIEDRLVDVVTIDGLLQSGRIGQPQFMKVDVQGFELRVLEGASQAMRKCDAIMLEHQFFRWCPSMTLVHESIAWMAARSFLPYEIVDILRRPLDGAMGQCDILFVREGDKLVQDIRWA